MIGSMDQKYRDFTDMLDTRYPDIGDHVLDKSYTIGYQYKLIFSDFNKVKTFRYIFNSLEDGLKILDKHFAEAKLTKLLLGD